MVNRNWQKHLFRKRVWEESDKKCFYCRKDMVFKGKQNGKFMTVEHLTPKSQGGTNTLENCVAACNQCNKARGTMKIKDFIDKLTNQKKDKE